MFVGVQVPLRVPQARIAQLVEHDLAKVGVAGSSPVSRSKLKASQEIVELFSCPEFNCLCIMPRSGSWALPSLGESGY